MIERSLIERAIATPDDSNKASPDGDTPTARACP
jgi:hypothetical protein